MKNRRLFEVRVTPSKRGRALLESAFRQRRGIASDEGFTLIELLIVVTIVPIIIGALSSGLLAVFSLQSGVANRLSNSGDAQVVAASFRNDVQSAAFITTDSTPNLQCGTGTQLLGMEWNPNTSGGSAGGGFQTIVSYVSIPVVNGSTTTYSLVRQICTVGTNGVPVLNGSYLISTNLPGSQAPPTVTCTAAAASCSASTDWVNAQDVTGVTFAMQQPEKGVVASGCPANTYCYTLAAVPAISGTVPATGGPITVNTTAGCAFADAGSGTFASSLCLVDFSSLTGNNLLAAQQGCLAISVPLPGGATLYFCISISGTSVAPYLLPTYGQAFLGNSNNGTGFYTGIDGRPALYQNVQAGTTTVTIKDISVVGATGDLATGWEAVGVDAESTDNGESMTWTSDQTLTAIPNGQSVDTPSAPFGNACNAGAGLTGSGTTQVICNGNGTTGSFKTGTAMVAAVTPTIITTKMVGTGLEAMAFGLLL